MNRFRPTTLKKSLILGVLLSFFLSFAISFTLFFMLEWLYPDYEAIISYDDQGNIEDVAQTHLASDQKQRMSILCVVQPTVTILCFIACNCLFLSWYYRRTWQAPINELLHGAERIMNNDLDFEVHSFSTDEFGQIAQAFERLRQNTETLMADQQQERYMQEQMLAAFAHDLKTPLTIISGEATLASRLLAHPEASREMIAESFPTIQNNVRRIEKNVDAMRKTIKLEAAPYQPTTLPYSKLADDTKHHLELLTANTDKTIGCHIQPDDATLQLDTDIFFTVLDNVVTNSLRHASHIDLFMSHQSQRLFINVQDNGPGFSDYILKHGTEPFVREGEEPQTHFGLGLYICQVLCKKHGGCFSIANTDSGALCRMIFNVH